MTNKESLPKGWKLVRLRDICEIITGNTPSSKVKEYYGGDFMWAGPTDLDVEDYVTNTRKTLTQKGVTEGKARVVPKNSTMLCCIGATLGRCGIATKDMATNQQINSFVPDNKKVNYKFLFYAIKAFNDLFKKNSSTTTLPIINKGRCKEIEIPLPPLPVQEAIVAKLTESQATLDKALEALREAKEGLDNVMSSAQHKLIPDDESEMPDGWEIVELQEVADINPKKSEVKEVPDDTEISFVPMAAVSERTGTIEDPQIREIGKVRKGYTYFADGDVLFAKITPCMENGKSAIAKDLKNGIGFGTTEFHVVRPSDRLKKEFIYSILRSQTFRNIAQQNMTGTAGQARVPTDFLKEYQIALPPVEAQLKVIERLAEIKKQVNAARDFYNEAFNRAQNIQQSLLQKAFQGELVTESKESVATTKTKVDWFKLKQIIGVIIRDLGQKSTLRGEMVLAKFTYLLQELYGANAGLQFKKHNFGPYNPAIKKAILASAFNKDKFFKVSGSGNAQVYALGKNSDKLFKYESEEVRNAESGMVELMKKIAKLPSEKIELLATVCKIIQDSQSIDPDVIWEEMNNWKTEKRDSANKADLFDQDSVDKCLGFIKTQGWEAKLIAL